jgi:hypothetical protein
MNVMEDRKFEQLAEQSAKALEERETFFSRKLEARRIVELEIEAMKKAGEAHEISEEEIRMVRSFRRFKVTCKAGDIFKWQTRPIDGVSIHVDTSLVKDPQEVS